MTMQQGPTKVGELRPSQLMHSFGVGAIVDLPQISVIVMGLDDWSVDPGNVREVSEDRLLRTVRWQLGSQVQRLLTPPAAPETVGFPDPFDPAARVGVPVRAFPSWMRCPKCQLLAPLDSGLFELRAEPFHPDRTKFVHVNCQRAMHPTVVPARFMVACENGHLDDFPWLEYVHRGPTTCPGPLRLIERGEVFATHDIEVRCDRCRDRRPMSQAFGGHGRGSMPQCRGRRPHLADFDDHGCDIQVRAIVLGASNLWFADVLSTLAIPTESARLAQLVDEHWADLQHAHDLSGVGLLRRVSLLGDFVGYSDDQIWEEIERKRARLRSDEDSQPVSLKEPEWQIFTHPDRLTPTDDLRLKMEAAPAGFASCFESVVLAERLREARALVGFTRIDAPGELDEGQEIASTRRMRLSRLDPAWVPACDIRGEGIFIQLKESRVQEWLRRRAVRERDASFSESHRRWRTARNILPADGGYPGVRYVLLHSFAHALMRQLSIECGYTAASIRERIYSRNVGDPAGEPMAGVLIYTGAPDSEGTLGGLVSLGNPDDLRRLLVAAMHEAQRCASDPLCAENAPSQNGITLHAAACHACLFAPETSCERGNKYLDRGVLAPTVDARPEHEGLAFFEVEG